MIRNIVYSFGLSGKAPDLMLLLGSSCCGCTVGGLKNYQGCGSILLT